MNAAAQEVTFSLLADYPQFVEPLAKLHFREWSHLRPGETLEQRTARLHTCCQRDRLPLGIVAHRDGGPLGSALLVPEDLPLFPEYSPWLAAVYVDEAHRGRGLGQALVRRALEAAAGLSIARLYLFTEHAATLYLRCGGRVLHRTEFSGAPIAVMELPVPEVDSPG